MCSLCVNVISPFRVRCNIIPDQSVKKYMEEDTIKTHFLMGNPAPDFRLGYSSLHAAFESWSVLVYGVNSVLPKLDPSDRYKEPGLYL